MGYERGGRFGEDRGQDDNGFSYRRGGQGAQGQDRYGPRGETRYGGYEGGRGAQDFRGQRDHDDDDRGFFDRAGDEVRSWFGDDDASRRREQDGRYDDDDDRPRSQGYRGQPQGERSRESYGQSHYTQSYGGGARGGQSQSYGQQGGRESAYGQGQYGSSRYTQGGQDDVHGYGNWRQRQIEQLDRDYDEYRREHQSQFDQQFHSWREKRTGQRSSLGKVNEHMEVVGSDGQHIGTVDKVRGDRIILTKNDPEAGGHHHSIPCSWIESVDDKITVNKTHDEAQRQWRDEERNKAMFGDDDQSQSRITGERARSSGGTY